ncbi:MAG: formate dehydrogenase subunit gamma, partial [Hyphomicrobiaceae bacterium]|nr:formate dehydrogenase subunit gamma [Hyphomicrobiaceae bacterium]
MRTKLAMIAACVALAIAGAGHVAAQQPTSVNPTAAAVKEDKLLEALKPNAAVTGRVSIPDAKLGKLIQPEGRDYKAERDRSARIGGFAIVGIFAALVLFYLIRGPVKITGGRSGQTITRFAFLDRFAHWLTASSFILLALTGLNLT